MKLIKTCPICHKNIASHSRLMKSKCLDYLILKILHKTFYKYNNSNL
jgi:hypothetical protein